MILTIDTQSLSASEAKGMIALLSTLHPATNSTLQASAPAPQISTQISTIPVPRSDEDAKPAVAVVSEPESAASTASTVEAPETAPAKPRGRPRKETPSEPAQQAEAPAAKSNGKATVISPEGLRELLNAYISKHSMEDAIGKLKSYGCNRVTEALALEADKLQSLVQELQ